MINLELAKDIRESLSARKIGGAHYIMSSKEVELAYEVFNDYIILNDEASVDVVLPFDVIQSLGEVSLGNAVKYFREHGLEKSKKHLLDVREAINQVSWVHSLEGFSKDLKRLVESHELVKDYYGLTRAKEHAESNYTAPEIKNALKQAIADVESCVESDGSLKEVS